MIRIGSQPNKIGNLMAENLKNKLSSQNYDSEVISSFSGYSHAQSGENQSFSENQLDLAEVTNLLLNSEIDIYIYPLDKIPTTPKSKIVIAGLSERNTPSDSLLIKEEYVDPNMILSLAHGSSVICDSDRRVLQLSHYRPDLKITKLPTSNCTVSAWEISGSNALIIDGNTAAQAREEIKNITLNPKEFIPHPGQGVMAYMCRAEDITSRKLIASIHDSSVASCTNVERKTLQLLGDEEAERVGIYCESPGQNVYRIYANNPNSENIGLIQLSQSTTVGLAENLIKKLTQEII